MKNRHTKSIHYIYEITNLINGRKYIGQHSTNNIKDGYFGSGTLLDREIKQTGKEHFKIEILEYCEDYDHLQEREAFYVDEEKVISGRYYNLVRGGYDMGKSQGRLVIIYETFYRSITDAAEQYKIPNTRVAERCKSNDLEWRDWEFYDDAIITDPNRIRCIIDPLNPYNKTRVFTHKTKKRTKK